MLIREITQAARFAYTVLDVCRRYRLAHAVTVRTGKNAVLPEANKTGRSVTQPHDTPGRRCAYTARFQKRPLYTATPCVNACERNRPTRGLIDRVS